jgi:hypothetical protein
MANGIFGTVCTVASGERKGRSQTSAFTASQTGGLNGNRFCLEARLDVTVDD